MDIRVEMNVFDIRHVVVHALTGRATGGMKRSWALSHLKHFGDRIV